MQENKLVIAIQSPVEIAFKFAITPPNSIHWIPGIVQEEINELPVRPGTTYRLKDTDGLWSEVIVNKIIENQYVEWTSKDQIFHCEYRLTALNDNTCQLEYHEWVQNGILDKPFTQKILNRLKYAIESQY